jgi:acyl-CoA thioester hydrolase
MKLPRIPVEHVTALEPPCLRMTVSQSFADRNGHMNMRHYVALFDDAGDIPETGLYDRLGLTPEFHRQNATTTMDLEFHVSFVSEVMPGHDVAIYFRLAGYSSKLLHYLMFMVDENRGNLGAVFECVNAFVDFRTRKIAPYPPAILRRLEDVLAAHRRLEWAPPLCGAMQL